MLKMTGKALTLGVMCLISVNVAADCSQFEADAEAYEGVVPKFDGDGNLRALLMYGEGTFLFPKRSLIAEARRKAELTARRAYAEFLKSDFDAATVAEDFVQTEQVTDESGNTAGIAIELTSTLNEMRQNTQATLSGIVKLDECVSQEGKYVLVQLGWKPSTSAAAADAKQTMNNDIARGDESEQSNQDSSGAKAKPASSLTPVKGYRKKSSLADDF
jgi:hypothetical protein